MERFINEFHSDFSTALNSCSVLLIGVERDVEPHLLWPIEAAISCSCYGLECICNFVVTAETLKGDWL